MARDYAKTRKPETRTSRGSTRKKPAQQRRGSSSRGAPASRPGSSWRAYLAGLLSGFFISFILYLATMPAGELPGINPAPVAAAPTTASAPAEPPKPRFDFYTMLPQQTVDGPMEPAGAADPPAGTASEVYLLQAGSFRQRNDADRRRAELLLLGLEPRVEEADSDNGRWFRVYLGPFDSHPKMTRARSLTAAQDIDTLLLKRGTP